MKRILITSAFVTAALVSLNACAAENKANSSADKKSATASAGSAEVTTRAALAKILPGAPIDMLKPAGVPLENFMQAVIGGNVYYISNDGSYILDGALINIETRENVTDQVIADIRAPKLAKISKDRRIVFAPKDPKYTITVFTDIDCGYCRVMHQKISEYNRLGIGVEYLFFPREGVGSESFDKAVSVWCAEDRLQAMTDAKAGKELPKAQCENPVTADYDLGQQVGVNGTPAVFGSDGKQYGGFVEPAQLLERLQANDQKAKSSAAVAGKS